MTLLNNVRKSKQSTRYTARGKNNIKRMASEKVLYAQVIMIRRKDLKFVATDNNNK